jgi:hypothetical protein
MVLPAERNLVRGKETIERFPHPVPVKAIAARSAGEPGYDPALDVSLEIEGYIIRSLMQITTDSGNLVTCGVGERIAAPCPGPDHMEPVHQRVPFEDIVVSLLDRPIDLDAGNRPMEVIQYRKGVDDIFQWRHSDDQDPFGHSTIPRYTSRLPATMRSMENFSSTMR